MKDACNGGDRLGMACSSPGACSAFLGRGEWVMAIEDIPLKEYEKLAEEFDPPPNVARQWARLARESEMKYVLITAKFHDGFCLFDTPTTDYCATRQYRRPRSCAGIR